MLFVPLSAWGKICIVTIHEHFPLTIYGKFWECLEQVMIVSWSKLCGFLVYTCSVFCAPVNVFFGSYAKFYKWGPRWYKVVATSLKTGVGQVESKRGDVSEFVDVTRTHEGVAFWGLGLLDWTWAECQRIHFETREGCNPGLSICSGVFSLEFGLIKSMLTVDTSELKSTELLFCKLRMKN